MGHHFVPQGYLRNFEDPNRPGFIWLHDKRGRPIHAARIAQVAQTRGFYSEETETILAHQVEAPANAVLDKLTKNIQISPGERLQLAHYIGVMLKRVPARRRRAAELIPGALADAVAHVKERLRSLASAAQADQEALAGRLEELNTLEQEYGRQLPPDLLQKIWEPWPSNPIVQPILDMTWRVLVSTGPQYFVTTDNPVFFSRKLGIGKRESELSFPLSTTHALHGSRVKAKSDLVFLPASQPFVREINRRLASEAERLAFYHKAAPWLLKILQKKNPYLSVMRWANGKSDSRVIR